MIRYIVKRLFNMIFVLLGVTFLIFTIMWFCPGDPARSLLSDEATEEQVEALRDEMGLNDPFLVQFGRYVYDVVVNHDLGQSYQTKLDVSSEIASRFLNTVQVACLAILIAAGLGIPLGVIAAVNQSTWKDNTAMAVSLMGVSMPGFWFGLMLSLLFALKLGLLPASGFSGPKYLILPCAAIGIGGVGMISRQMRSSMLEVIRQDYVTTARAKGQVEWKVIYKHAFRNALIPVITQIGSMFGHQLGGAMVAETVFSIPGLGTYMVNAIKARDYPAVRGSVLYVAFVFAMVM
ncbi:MAG: ABC transporter permease, partial [Lachnospiraceae bacterium]|nr:ABC transporter permease [Lachnospiraceae bacterium]